MLYYFRRILNYFETKRNLKNNIEMFRLRHFIVYYNELMFRLLRKKLSLNKQNLSHQYLSFTNFMFFSHVHLQ